MELLLADRDAALSMEAATSLLALGMEEMGRRGQARFIGAGDST